MKLFKNEEEKQEIRRQKEEKEYLLCFEDYKKKHLPPEYNQLDLVNYFCRDDLDHYLSVSNRGDGKSFNYISWCLYASNRFGIGVMFVVRHFDLQPRIKELIEDIISTIKWTDSPIWYRNTSDYVVVGLGDKEIAIITDLNNASDLKYSSSTIKKFPFIIYDEFLALKQDYVHDEWIKLKTIYQSIDRTPERPYIKHPKILYLGNAVNFESPILPNLNLYNALQYQEKNTSKIYNNKILEIRINNTVNERKNNRAFPDDNDSMLTASFNFSNYLLLNENEYNKNLLGGIETRINIGENNLALVIIENDLTVLSIELCNGTEDYCINLEDETKDMIFLNDSYYSNNMIKKHEKGLFYYKDSYSRSFIQASTILTRLKIYKCLPDKAAKLLDKEAVTKKIMYDNMIKKIANRYQ